MLRAVFSSFSLKYSNEEYALMAIIQSRKLRSGSFLWLIAGVMASIPSSSGLFVPLFETGSYSALKLPWSSLLKTQLSSCISLPEYWDYNHKPSP